MRHDDLIVNKKDFPIYGIKEPKPNCAWCDREAKYVIEGVGELSSNKKIVFGMFWETKGVMCLKCFKEKMEEVNNNE